MLTTRPLKLKFFVCSIDFYFEDLKVPDRSPELTEEQLKDPLRIAAHEKIDDFEGMTLGERREIEEKKEADHKAQVPTYLCRLCLK